MKIMTLYVLLFNSLFSLLTLYAWFTLNYTLISWPLCILFLLPCTYFPTLWVSNSQILYNSGEINSSRKHFLNSVRLAQPFLFCALFEKKKIILLCYSCLFTCLFPLQANSFHYGRLSTISICIARAVTSV